MRSVFSGDLGDIIPAPFKYIISPLRHHVKRSYCVLLTFNRFAPYDIYRIQIARNTAQVHREIIHGAFAVDRVRPKWQPVAFTEIHCLVRING